MSLVERQQRCGGYAGFEVGALRTVTAVLGTPAGFDAEKHTALDVGRVVMFAMDRRGAVEQVRQRQTIDGLQFGECFHAIDL